MAEARPAARPMGPMRGPGGPGARGMTVSSSGTVVERVAASVGAVAEIVVVGWVDAGLPQQEVRRRP